MIFEGGADRNEKIKPPQQNGLTTAQFGPMNRGEAAKIAQGVCEGVPEGGE